MKHKHDGGFSLIEVLVAMVILAACVIPTCTSLVLSYRMNAKAEEMLQAQLAVSSAVETLMAEGIPTGTESTKNGEYYDVTGTVDRFPDVRVTVTSVQGMPYYTVTVTDNEKLVTVETTIREAKEVATE